MEDVSCLVQFDVTLQSASAIFSYNFPKSAEKSSLLPTLEILPVIVLGPHL